MSEWQPIETAPRDGTRILLATPADIEANIASEHYFTAMEGAEAHDDPGGVGGLKDYPKSLGLLTFCVLVLRNGFTVTGESACASPENFDAELGRKIARQNADCTLIDLVTGRPRRWYMRADGIKRWVSNDQPCDVANEADLWRCTACGRIGSVGRCCGTDTREPVRTHNAEAQRRTFWTVIAGLWAAGLGMIGGLYLWLFRKGNKNE
jgi:hypothetical protein